MDRFPLLVTPEPHYIPGYTGYCPQLKYNMGRTYGQLTSKLLTSTRIPHIDRPLMSSASDTAVEILKKQTAPEHLNRMIPGYTGFIPRSKKYFSKTYAETCRDALREFEWDQKKSQYASACPVPAINYTFEESKKQKLNTPLPVISEKPISFSSVNGWKPLGSPYLMKDSDPHKYFISGFTGYVPKSRFLIGKGYPMTTNEALIMFGKEMRKGHAGLGVKRESSDSLPQLSTGHRPNQAMLPYYTGHIPGYRFQHGKTFGYLTSHARALERSHREERSQD